MRPPGEPRPLRFVVTGALIGFVVLGAYSLTTPNTNEQTGATYSAVTAFGYMAVVGALVGALLGAVLAAALSSWRNRG